MVCKFILTEVSIVKALMRISPSFSMHYILTPYVIENICNNSAVIQGTDQTMKTNGGARCGCRTPRVYRSRRPGEELGLGS